MSCNIVTYYNQLFMKKTLITLVFGILLMNVSGQYKLEKEIDGVQFYTKWGKEFWYKLKSDKVLLIKVVNTNEEAVRFDLGIEFTENLQLVQEGMVTEYCLGAKRKLLPRVNGIMYKYAMKSEAGSETEYELTGLTVAKVPSCDEE